MKAIIDYIEYRMAEIEKEIPKTNSKEIKFMAIEITKTIKEMLDCCPPETHEKILEQAWDACCDGEFLAVQGIKVDLWDGKNEQDRIVFELNAIRGVIFINDFWDLDSKFVDIKY